MQKKDLTNMVFGRLTALKNIGRDNKNRLIWECLCECGAMVQILSWNLVSGTTKSCGCLKAESVKTQSLTHGGTANKIKSVEYCAWLAMKSRCYDENNADYKNYGGRGIKVCGRWINSFENFFADMGERPSRNHSLDRFPNVNGDYEPKNCRWATQKEQQQNRRNNRWHEYNGEKLVQVEWAKRFNMTPSALCMRLKNISFQELAKNKL